MKKCHWNMLACVLNGGLPLRMDKVQWQERRESLCNRWGSEKGESCTLTACGHSRTVGEELIRVSDRHSPRGALTSPLTKSPRALQVLPTSKSSNPTTCNADVMSSQYFRQWCASHSRNPPDCHWAEKTLFLDWGTRVAGVAIQKYEFLTRSLTKACPHGVLLAAWEKGLHIHSNPHSLPIT